MRSSSVISAALLLCAVLCGTSLYSVYAAVSQVTLMTSDTCTSIPHVQAYVVPTNGTCTQTDAGSVIVTENSDNTYNVTFYTFNSCSQFSSSAILELNVCGLDGGGDAAWITTYETFPCSVNFWSNPTCQDTPMSTTNGLEANYQCTATGNLTYDIAVNPSSGNYRFWLNCGIEVMWNQNVGGCATILGLSSASVTCDLPTPTIPTMLEHKKTNKHSNPHTTKITNKVLKNKSATHKNKHAAKKH